MLENASQLPIQSYYMSSQFSQDNGGFPIIPDFSQKLYAQHLFALLRKQKLVPYKLQLQELVYSVLSLWHRRLTQFFSLFGTIKSRRTANFI